MSNLQRVFRRYPPGVWTVTLIGFLNAAAFAISLPFLSLYLYQERGISMTLVGTIILVTGLCSAATQMFAGALSDRFGRRPLLLGAVATGVVVYGIMAWLIALTAPVLAISAAFLVGRTALMTMRPAISAIVADLTPKSQLTEAYGLLRIGQNAGWAAGPAVGGYMLAVVPYAWLFATAALGSAITFTVIVLFLKESFRGALEKVRMRDVFRTAGDRSFAWFTLMSFLVFLVMAQMASTLSVFTVDRVGFSTAQYGMLLTLNGVLVVLFQLPVTRLTDRFPKPKILVLGALLYAIGYGSVGWDTMFSLGMASMVVITAGEIAFTPNSQAVVGELSPRDWRGRYMGFFGLAETLGMSFGPLLGGVLLDTFPSDRHIVWAVIAAVAIAAALGFYRWGATRQTSAKSSR